MGRLCASILCGLLAPGLAGSAAAQVAPRLTGSAVIAELDAARHELSTRAAGLPHSSLSATGERLAGMADVLRKSFGGDAGKPVDILDAGAKAGAYRAHAAAERVKAFLDASQGCPGADANAMADALASTVAQLAAASGSAKAPPVIDGVETADHRPLFVLHGNGKEQAFALVGANLLDPQCEDPRVTATDAQGRLQAIQPGVTGVSPGRIELKLAAGERLPPGSYVLRVAPKHKAFLVGCTAQPEAVAVVQVAPPVKVSVSYTLGATCRAGNAERVMPPISGTLPEITGAGTVSQQIDMAGCVDPLSYAVSAKATFGDGHVASIGPISQIASAGITAGLPGGLSLSWDPSVRQLFVRAGASSCKGVY